MRVCVILEHRFDRTPDGAVWTGSNHTYAELSRYLGVFDEVRIVARVRDVAQPPEPGHRADGDGVSIWPVPYYLGFEQFCRRMPDVWRSLTSALPAEDAILLRAPSTLSSLAGRYLRRSGRPFAVELIGDPWDLFSKGSVRHPLRPFFRWSFRHLTRSLCERACAVSYVSGRLRARYPASSSAFQTSVSDVVIPDRFWASEPRPAPSRQPLRILTVGSMEHLYKGADILIEAVSRVVRRGVDVELTIVGDGKYRPKLAALAARLGIGERVEFAGKLPAGEAVFAEMDRADLFVLPSRSEGLPRAMLEAMARAVPCLGSTVGGIPELLSLEDMVSPGEVEALAAKIGEVVKSPSRLEQMSRRCLERARDYAGPALDSRARDFFTSLRAATEKARGDSAGLEAPRVLEILTRLGAGGATSAVIALTREMSRAGWDARLITGHCDEADLDMGYLLEPGDHVEFVPEMSRSLSPINDWKAFWRLVRLIRELRPDVVHTHTAKAGTLGRLAARLAGVPVTAHTFHGHVLSGYFSPLKSHTVRLGERLMAHLTDAICVVSPQQAGDIRDRFHIAQANRVHVLPLGIDIGPFRTIPPPSPQTGALTVGWLGRFFPVKDLGFLIEVVEEALARSNGIRFIVAGDGPERRLMESVPRKWREEGRLIWLGWRKDVPEVIAQCDLLIQTSRNEGTPIALLQGMAAARPFVSTAVGGVVDMTSGAPVREISGCRWYRNAVIVDANPTVFASRLCELESRPDEVVRMGQEAARFVAAHHNLGAFAAAHAALYSELLARKRRSSLPERSRHAGRKKAAVRP